MTETISQSRASAEGLRQFNAGRDLAGVTLLLEAAFRDDIGFLRVMSKVPVLRELRARLWAASFGPALSDSLLGFVWQDGNQIIGNVTLTPDEVNRHHWLVSNVAVDERHRRRGIGRELMQAAIAEAARRRATNLILNVRPQNAGAIRLYEQLGFHIVDTEMAFTLRAAAAAPASSPGLPLRRLKVSDYRAAFDLNRDTQTEELKLFRPSRASDYALTVEDRLTERIIDLFIAQSTERWGYFENGNMLATVLLHAQRIGSPHWLAIHVALGGRGKLERGLVSSALARLGQFPRREISTRVMTNHHELVEALTDEGFRPTQGLTLMAKPMGGGTVNGKT